MKDIDLPQLDDEAFIREFERLSLNPVHFSHLEHIRLAWLYLNENELDVAIEKVCNGIKAYATSLGASTKFNLTMTDAFVRIISGRMDNLGEREWQLFLQENSDLVDNAPDILRKHFTDELLFSETARTTLVLPDREPFI